MAANMAVSSYVICKNLVAFPTFNIKIWLGVYSFFFSVSNHIEYMHFLVEHVEKHNYAMDTKQVSWIMLICLLSSIFHENVNFQGFKPHWFTRSEII